MVAARITHKRFNGATPRQPGCFQNGRRVGPTTRLLQSKKKLPAMWDKFSCWYGKERAHHRTKAPAHEIAAKVSHRAIKNMFADLPIMRIVLVGSRK
jgi:hypothetical protein